MAKLSEKELEKYKAAGAMHCPMCEAGDVETVEIHPHTDSVSIGMACWYCDGEWRETHELASVEIVQPGTPPKDEKGAG